MKNLATLKNLLDSTELTGRTATVHWNGWQRGRVVSVGPFTSTIYFFDFGEQADVPNQAIIPDIPKKLIEKVLKLEKKDFNLELAIKQHSLAAEPGAARSRFERTQTIAEILAKNVFPLSFNGTLVELRPFATPLSRQNNPLHFFRAQSLAEPSVEFGHRQSETDIREGITKFGSYSDTQKTIEIVPLCTASLRDQMVALIERLKTGKYKYHGSERTFHTRFIYNDVVLTTPEMALDQCKRLLSEHPDWIGNKALDRLFLVHIPEMGYALDDERSPYYLVKRYLLEQGIPCQMIDTPTIRKPDWKDLNLALNVVAKCDVTPWVLPDAIPDADFFVGLSYTQSTRQLGERLMGYANVFNRFGKWEFYSGNTETFNYAQRAHYFEILVKMTLERLNLSETPSIHFHYSAKFSREDRQAILNAARSVRPQGNYTFVWINTHHNVRLYDTRAETNGSLSRGSYVITSPNQVYLSTTGHNPFRKTLGTAQMLELNVRVERPASIAQSPPDPRLIALQILSLTKLNWASTDSLCGEPITTKYASDIAYLTSAFLRQKPGFRLHPVLEKTPWFL